MMFSFRALYLLSSFLALTSSSPPIPNNEPLELRDEKLPSPTNNPYYPCGATRAEVKSCPYRCFTASTGALVPKCFTESTATAAIKSLKYICTKCLVPPKPPTDCTPLLNYFNGDRPARCGGEASDQFVPSCAWNCAAAQVPFDICDTSDTSGTFRKCVKCKPQCSSPRIVFNPARGLPKNFNLATGNCSSEYGKQEVVACPWRCTDAGNPNKYCSLQNKTNTPNGFTTCEKC